MAVEMFLKFEPKVEGESRAKDHKGEISILSFSFGISQSSSAHLGGGSGAGKADFSSISFQKLLDKSSVPLFVSAASGKHFDKATILCREVGGDALVDYWTIELEQVFVDNMQWGAAEGSGKPSESLSLSYAKIKQTYQSQDEKGKSGSPIVGGWDVQVNTKL